MPIIRVSLFEGRTVEQKRELVEALTREASRVLGTKPEVTYVVLEEVNKENWGIGGRLAAER